MDRNADYVRDVDYLYGYYVELNPLRARLALLSAGLVPPEIRTACELGFGQGMSINIHAAAQPGCAMWGTDFNPAQAGFAQSLAAACGSSPQLFDQSFAEFCARDDLPDFDSIGLHGIWTWISDENRAVIVDFVRRKLKVGGVLYVSYNTQPGWAPMVPVRDLLCEHGKVMSASGHGVVSSIDAGLAFADRLIAANSRYTVANPQVVERLKQLKGQNRTYLAHEYFNGNWTPMGFSRMAEWLAPAKLTYACSAFFLDHIDALNLTAEQQALLKDIPDPVFRQTVRDFCVNQHFRRDYWVKGARRMSALEQGEALRAQRLVLTQPRSDVSLTLVGSIGEARLQEAVHAPLLDVLADHQPRCLGEIADALAPTLSFAQVVQASVILIGTGALQLAQDADAADRARACTARLNAVILDKARSGDDIAFLASPVLGGGFAVGRVQQLFERARSQGQPDPREWAASAWRLLSGQGQKIAKENHVLETDEENLAEFNALALAYAEKELPILKALGIA